VFGRGVARPNTPHQLRNFYDYCAEDVYYNLFMKYNFDTPPDRKNTESIKWEAYPPDVIPLWVADMDFPSPEPVVQALVERARHGVFGYPRGISSRSGDNVELAQIFAGYLLKKYDWSVDLEALVFVPGVVTGLNIASLAFAAPVGGVLVQTPVYPPIHSAAATTGAISQEMELSRQSDGTYWVDWDRFDASFTPQTRLLMLCNPHNPIGHVFRQDELERMAEICLKHKVILCSDEIHCDLIYPGYRHIPIASLDPEIARHTITFMAPSKTYNLAGLQCSVAIIPDLELRQQFLAARKGLAQYINLMGVVAAQVAYRDGQDWLDQVLSYLCANRDTLFEAVRTELPGIKMALPEATYLGWLDCRGAKMPGGPYKFFLEQARVAFSDGAAFGKGGEGFVRINFGCSRSLLAEAIERMKSKLATLG
jgi:cysteine-S-conjugate beta-lyase